MTKKRKKPVYEITLFPEAVFQIREDLGLSQEELDSLCGLPKGTIGHYEAGRRKPGMRNLIKIASSTGADMGWLMGALESSGV